MSYLCFRVYKSYTGHLIYLYLVKQICSYYIFFLSLIFIKSCIWISCAMFCLFFFFVIVSNHRGQSNTDVLNLEPDIICYKQKCALGPRGFKTPFPERKDLHPKLYSPPETHSSGHTIAVCPVVQRLFVPWIHNRNFGSTPFSLFLGVP